MEYGAKGTHTYIHFDEWHDKKTWALYITMLPLETNISLPISLEPNPGWFFIENNNHYAMLTLLAHHGA